MIRRLNLAVLNEAVFHQLGTARRPLGTSARRRSYQLLRETYFDTADGLLRSRRMVLKLRTDASGRQLVELAVVQAVNLNGIVEELSFETPVVDGGFYVTLAGTSEVANRLREVVEPHALRPQVALDIDREIREVRSGLFGRTVHRMALDEVVAHAPGGTRALHEVTLTELAKGRPSLETLAARLRARHAVENDGLTTYERVRALFAKTEEGSRVEAPHGVRVALLLIHEGSVALVDAPSGLVLPTTRGSGEDLAREYLGEVQGDGAGEGLDLDLVGFAAPRKGRSDLEVWLHEASATAERPRGFVWLPLLELMERVGGPRLRDPGLIATLLMLVRSEIGLRLMREVPRRARTPQELPLVEREPEMRPGDGPEDFLDLELSILDFNQRVLEMAEDPSVPLLERLRFLSIFASNTDEFFVVRVSRLKDEAARGASDGDEDLSAGQLLDLVAIRVRALLARQYSGLNEVLLPELAQRGVRIRQWDELRADQRSALSKRFSDEIFPLLTPLKLEASSVRSFPRLVSLGLALAAVLRGSDEGRPELGYVAVPKSLSRFLAVPDSPDLIAVEEVIGANASRLFSAEVEDVHLFRACRTADVEIDEDSSGSLLAAIADEVEERPFKPVIRVEVQPTMPREFRAFLLKEIRAEQAGDAAMLTREDIYEADGLIDLTGVAELADLALEDGLYPPYAPVKPLDEAEPVFDVLTRGDVLVHHPFHDFESTVGCFLSEAAADPDVAAIKLTLYRTGRHSPIMDALLAAQESGKDVSVFVELKARFDEESNIEWTQRLKAAGANVVTGVVGYKTHAKTALVVRREEAGVRRYVHIGTGNYNAQTARFYTDLGLMSADPDLGADLHDFFNALTSSERPPEKQFRRLLVAPNSLVQEIQRMITREMDHAAAGRPARIQAKLNGLADRKVVKALYRASQAGVDIDLIVRSICTLRPGLPGLSDGIHVRSILGRFLEHSRIYYFENAGQSEYYIGSADWRARNLRRRVEVATPVDDPVARGVLRSILDVQLADPRAWVLRPDGIFERLTGDGLTSQEHFMRTAGDAETAVR